MKKSIIVLCCLLGSFLACNKVEPSTDEIEYIEIGVRSFLENIDFSSEEPLTRAATSSNDAYGIQINLVTGNYGSSAYYYSGLYDDISLLKSIRLIKGRQYHIASCYIPNCKLYQPNVGKPGNYPFCPWPSENASFPYFEFNTDYYNSAVVFSGFSHDLIGGGWNGEATNVDYYVYSTRDYVAEEGKTLDIKYKRYNADLTINFVKDEVQYDKIKVTYEGFYGTTTNTIALTNGEGQFKLTNVMLMYEHEEEERRIIVSTEDGSHVFYDGMVTLKRNKNRIYSIRLSPATIDAGIVISYDDSTSTDEDSGEL